MGLPVGIAQYQNGVAAGDVSWVRSHEASQCRFNTRQGKEIGGDIFIPDGLAAAVHAQPIHLKRTDSSDIRKRIARLLADLIHHGIRKSVAPMLMHLDEVCELV